MRRLIWIGLLGWLIGPAQAQMGLPAGQAQLVPFTAAVVAATCQPVVINVSQAVVISAIVNVC